MKTEDDAKRDDHHEQERTVVLASATALIGILKLWQEKFLRFPRPVWVHGQSTSNGKWWEGRLGVYRVSVCVGLGDGVVASGGEGMAAGQAEESQPASAEPSMTDDGDVRILAAGGKVLALRDREDVQQRSDTALVEG